MSQTFAQLINGKSATVEFSTGSASTPSVAFSGDTNTGIYSPGADQVAISTGGSGRLFVDASGRVGVGDSAPESILHLKGSNAVLKIESSVNTGYSGVEFDRAADDTHFAIYAYDASHPSQANNVQFYGYQNGSIQFATNSQERLRITSAGLVGVGTTSPSDTSGFGGTLDVNGTTGAACYVRTNGSATNFGLIGHYGTDLYVTNNSNGPTRFFTNGGERLRITSAGLVGIGTSSPGSLLTVKSPGAATTFFNCENSSGTSILRLFQTAGGSGRLIVSDSTGTDFFNVQADQGRVGIGTTTPDTLTHLYSSTAKTTVGESDIIRLAGQSTDNTVGARLEIGFNYAAASRKNFATIGYITTDTTSFCKGDLYFATRNVTTDTAPTERARIDSSGRLLVGTSSSVTGGVTGVAKIQVLGNTSGTAAVLNLGSTSAAASIPSGSGLGYLSFSDNGAGQYAWIACETDAAGGTNDYPGRLVFSTTADGASSPTERMRITNAGSVLIGKTIDNGTTDGTVFRSNGFVGSALSASTNSSTSYDLYSSGAGLYRFYVGLGGTIYATSTTISAASDVRLKENIRDLDVGLDAILALKPRKFDWKEGKGKNIKDDRGFIAQEFEEIFPDLIDEWKDPAPEGEEPYKSVRQDLIPVLVKAMQEQQAMIAELQAEVAALKAQ